MVFYSTVNKPSSILYLLVWVYLSWDFSYICGSAPFSGVGLVVSCYIGRLNVKRLCFVERELFGIIEQ